MEKWGLRMCGIAGFCSFNGDYEADRGKWTDVLVGMRTALARRGSDQTGEYLGKSIGLAHTRLSIRDIDGGRQPMVRRAGGSDYAIIYNGEIYNAQELAAELRQAGWRFETRCDTETILAGYMENGPEFVKKLNGIFAFAIWDGRKNQLFLCRDRLGVKPLFYSVLGYTLVFGSECKALFQYPGLIPRADDDSFREIFGIGPARTPGCGVFSGVGELKPGECASFFDGALKIEKYWSLEAKPHTDSYERTVETVSFLVRDAVKRQMVSDVPVCTFLSGGLDSSIVTAIAAKYMAERGQTLNTFSFDFAGNDRYFAPNSFQPTRDRPYVDKMLAVYPTRHTYLNCEETRLASLLPEAVRAKDLPGMTDVDASLMYFCSLVKKQNKVALTGECADEIFGGYPWFYREELLNADGFPWSGDFAARTCLLSDETLERLHLKEYIRARYEQSRKETPLLAGESAEENRRREITYLNQRWFMQTLLNRMDRASMYSGLEARVPFADHRIVEYLYNVPWSMKYRPGMEKALLRDACSDLLPEELLRRKKSPYPKTYDPAYEQMLTARFRRLLKDAQAPANRFINREKAERFLSAPKDYGRPWFGQLMAGPQMLAYILQINDWMMEYALG
jgi:asparagine synthase (glutamine-hydrolysing)